MAVRSDATKSKEVRCGGEQESEEAVWSLAVKLVEVVCGACGAVSVLKSGKVKVGQAAQDWTAGDKCGGEREGEGQERCKHKGGHHC